MRERSAATTLCDRELQKTPEAMAQVETFSRHFIKTYGAACANAPEGAM